MALHKIHKGKYWLVKIQIILWEQKIFLVFLIEKACQWNRRSSTACSPGFYSLLLKLFHFLCQTSFRTESRLTIRSLLRQLPWFKFVCCCSWRMPGICPGECLPIIWWLNRDRVRIRFLFWTDQSNSYFTLSSEQPASETVYSSRLHQHIHVCFPSCPVFKKKKNCHTCFICIENRVLKSCGIMWFKTISPSGTSMIPTSSLVLCSSVGGSQFNSELLDYICHGLWLGQPLEK